MAASLPTHSANWPPRIQRGGITQRIPSEESLSAITKASRVTAQQVPPQNRPQTWPRPTTDPLQQSPSSDINPQTATTQNLVIALQNEPKIFDKLNNVLLSLRKKILRIYTKKLPTLADNQLSSNWLYLTNAIEMIVQIFDAIRLDPDEEKQINHIYNFLENDFGLKSVDKKTKIFWSLQLYKSYILKETPNLNNYAERIETIANCALSLIQESNKKSAQENLEIILRLVYQTESVVHGDFPKLQLTCDPKTRILNLAKDESFLEIFSELPKKENVLNYIGLKIWAERKYFSLSDKEPLQLEQSERIRIKEDEESPLSDLLAALNKPAIPCLQSAKDCLLKINPDLEKYQRQIIIVFLVTYQILTQLEKKGIGINFVKDKLKIKPAINEGLYHYICNGFMEMHQNPDVYKKAKWFKDLLELFDLFKEWIEDQPDTQRTKQASPEEIRNIKNLTSAYTTIHGLAAENRSGKFINSTCEIEIKIPNTNGYEKFFTDVATLLAIMTLNADFYAILKHQQEVTSAPIKPTHTA